MTELSKEALQKAEELLLGTEPPLSLGSRALKNPEAAAIVQNALLHHEAQRYFLWSWCVMPNHVHVIVSPRAGFNLPAITKSWKTFSARNINKLLGLHGAFWERETFDHLVGTPEHCRFFIDYIEMNPVVAGLCKAPEDWPFSGRGVNFKRNDTLEIVDPRKLPFSPIRGRRELPHLEKEGGTYFLTFRLLDAVESKKRQAGGLHHNED